MSDSDLSKHLLKQDLIPASESPLLAALLCGIHILDVQLCVAHRVAARRWRVHGSCRRAISLKDQLWLNSI